MAATPQQQQQQQRPARVAVIGAGAAGLVAARHATQHAFEVTVFEQTGSVGGTWVYTEQTHVDQYGLPVHSSMYDSLRTNLPKEIMGFLDYPFPSGPHSFIGREQVLDYLEDYAQHFHLYDYIQFYTRVINVKPVEKDGKTTWAFEVEDVKTKTRRNHVFDAVLVCNGHFSVPLIPDIPGLDTFEGHVMHSHEYRQPEFLRGKTVVCLGAGSSGLDIAYEASSVAKQVYLSHNLERRVYPDPPPNVSEVRGVTGASPRGFVFGQDSTQTHQADVLVLCTGYRYSFPFLDPSCGVRVTDNRVHPLYRDLISAEHPTLALVGLPFRVCPFPLFDVQAAFFLATVSGAARLPARHELLAAARADADLLDEAGVPKRFTHQFMEKQWPYMHELALQAGKCPPPPVMRKLFEHIARQRKLDPFAYRHQDYVAVDEEDFDLGEDGRWVMKG